VIPSAPHRPVLLDGAMGTALLGRGLPPDRLPEAWLWERPAEIAAVHAAHAAAGARVLLTCTFNLARLDAGAMAGQEADAARRAVALARGCRPWLVAGCVGATGLVGPDGRGPADGELDDRYGRAFRALADAGASLLWTETQVALREARAALRAARRTGLPVVVTAFLRPAAGGMEALDGAPPEELFAPLWRDGAAAVGVNCALPDAAMARAVAGLAVRVPVPLVAKASAGLPASLLGPEAFAAGLAAVSRAGARLVGGCCGAGPLHLRAAARALGLPAGQARG
jgi:5-methyltetrahydrofolate--homocysteine methyltransferase